MPDPNWQKPSCLIPLSRSEQKRLAIIEAARKIFLDKGFDGASMDVIAETANVSKRTVYNHYASKEALFGDVMLGMCQAKMDAMLLTLSPSDDMAEALTEFGSNFVNQILEPEGKALLRILVAHVDRFPELGQAFFDNGAKEVIATVAEYLRIQTQAGLITVDDPQDAAGSFLTSLHGEFFFRVLVTVAPPPEPAQVQKMVAAAVQRFLHGVLVRPV
ncbi:MAG: TetR/AcrR family transcriptional regulator [Magnetovibrio sp.]|nr:TetR/AcrR family transcriptional regulator [Magnetovibrio sp.]